MRIALTVELGRFIAGLRYRDIPQERVLQIAENLRELP